MAVWRIALCAAFAVLALLCSGAHAHGTVHLNEVVGASDDSVTIHDRFFSPDARIDTVETEALEVLRQFDLLVDVSSVALNGGKQGIQVNGALGASFISGGGITVASQTSTTTVTSSRMSVFSNELVIDGKTGVEVRAGVRQELVARQVDMSGANTTVAVRSDGPISFEAPAGEVSFISGRSLTVNHDRNVRFFSEIANVDIAAGNEFSVTTSDTITVDGHRGVSISSDVATTINAADAFSASGEHLQLSSFGDVLVSSTGLMSIYARHDVELKGDTVSVTGNQGLDIGATGAEANIQLSSEAGNVVNIPLGALQLSGGSPTATVGISAYGSVSVETPVFEAEVAKQVVVGTLSTSPVEFNAGDVTSFLTSYFDASAGWEARFNATEDVAFAADDVTMDGYRVEVLGDDVEVVASSEFDVISGEGRDILFEAGNGLTIEGNSVELDSHSSATISGDLGLTGDVLSLIVSPFSGHDIEMRSDFLTRLEATQDVSLSGYDVEAVVQTATTVTGNNLNLDSNENIRIVMRDDSHIFTRNLEIKSTELGGELVFATQAESGTTRIFSERDVSAVAAKQFLMSSTGGALFHTNSSSAGLGVRFMSSEITHLSSQESLVMSADRDVFVRRSGGSPTVTLESSIVEFYGKETDGVFDSSQETKIDAEHFVEINSVSGSVIYDGSVTTFSSRRDIRVTAQEEVTVRSNRVLTVDAVEELLFQGNGVEFESNSVNPIQIASEADIVGAIGGEFELSSNEDLARIESVDESVIFALEGSLSVSATTDVDVSGGDVLVKSGLFKDVSYTAGEDINIDVAANADPLGQIVFSGRVLDSSSGLNTDWEGGYVDMLSRSIGTNAGEDVFVDSEVATTDLDAQRILFNATRFADFTAEDEIYWKSGEAQDVWGSSAKGIRFSAGSDVSGISDNDIDVYVRNNTEVTALTSVQVTGSGSVQMNAEDEVHFVASEGLRVESGGRLEVFSALGHDTHLSSDDQLVGDVRNSLEVEGHALDGCAVKITTGVNTAGEFSSFAGMVFVRGEQGVAITSEDSLGEFGLTDGAILFTSTRDTNILAEDGAAMFFANGGFNDNFDGNGFRSILMRSTDEDGNIEFSADNAGLYVIGKQGVESSGAKFEALGASGVDVFGYGPTGDIVFNGLDVFFDGNRGLNISGGSVSPSSAAPLGIQSFTGDISFQADSEISIVSKDTVSNPLDLAVVFRAVNGDASFSTTNGHDVVISAADSALFDIDVSTSVVANAGDIELDSDVGDVIFLARRDLTISTVDGPLRLAGSGIGGSAEFSSSKTIQVTAPSIDLGANAGSQWSGMGSLTLTATERIGFETDRPVDDIRFQGSIVSVQGTGTGENDGVAIHGNNVEIEANGAGFVTLSADGAFDVGRSTSPIMSINVGDGDPALSIAAQEAVSLEATHVSRWVADGTVDLVGLQVEITSDDRINVISRTGDIVVSGDTLSATSKNQHVTSTNSLTLQSANQRVALASSGLADGDGVRFLSETTLDVTSELTRFVGAYWQATDDVRDINVGVTSDLVSFTNANHKSALADPAGFDLLDASDDVDPGYIAVAASDALSVMMQNDIEFHSGIHESVADPDILEDLESGRIDFITQGVSSPIHLRTLAAGGRLAVTSAGTIDMEANAVTVTNPLGSLFFEATDDSFPQRGRGDILIDAQNSITIDAAPQDFDFRAGAFAQFVSGGNMAWTAGPAAALSIDALNVTFSTEVDNGGDINVISTRLIDLSAQGPGAILVINAGDDIVATSLLDTDFVSSEAVIRGSAVGEVIFETLVAGDTMLLDATNTALFHSVGNARFHGNSLDIDVLVGDAAFEAAGGLLIESGTDAISFDTEDDMIISADGDITFHAAQNVDIDVTETIEFVASRTDTQTGHAIEVQSDTAVTISALDGDDPIAFLATDELAIETSVSLGVIAGETILMFAAGQHGDIQVTAQPDATVELDSVAGTLLLAAGNSFVGYGSDAVDLSTASLDLSLIAESDGGSVRIEAGEALSSAVQFQANSMFLVGGDILFETVHPATFDTGSDMSFLATTSIAITSTTQDVEIYSTARPIDIDAAAITVTTDRLEIHGGVSASLSYGSAILTQNPGVGLRHTEFVSKEGAVSVINTGTTAAAMTELKVFNTRYGNNFDVELLASSSLQLGTAAALTARLHVVNEADVGDMETISETNDIVIASTGDSTSGIFVRGMGGVQFIAYHPTLSTSGSIQGNTNVFTAGGSAGQVRLQSDFAVELETATFQANTHRLGFFEVTPVAEHWVNLVSNSACDFVGGGVGVAFCGQTPGDSTNHADGMASLTTYIGPLLATMDRHGLIESPTVL